MVMDFVADDHFAMEKWLNMGHSLISNIQSSNL